MVKSNGFTVVEVVLVLVVVAALGFAGWTWWQANQLSTQEEGEGNNKSQQKEQQQDDEDQIPEDWKVFSSEKIGFRFAYPSEWGQTELSIQDDTYSGKRFTVRFNPDATPYHVYSSGATPDFVWQTEYTGLGDFGYVENNGQIRYGVMNNEFRRPHENQQIMEEKKIGDAAFLSYSKTDGGLGGNHETYLGIINLSESEYASASVVARIDLDENETMTDKELSVFKRVIKTLKPIKE